MKLIPAINEKPWLFIWISSRINYPKQPRIPRPDMNILERFRIAMIWIKNCDFLFLLKIALCFR